VFSEFTIQRHSQIDFVPVKNFVHKNPSPPSRPSRDIFHFGERDRPGCTVQRPAERNCKNVSDETSKTARETRALPNFHKMQFVPIREIRVKNKKFILETAGQNLCGCQPRPISKHRRQIFGRRHGNRE
jgi:hypothetical protein